MLQHVSVNYSILVLGIIKAPRSDGETRLTFWKVRAVIDLSHPHLPPALPQGYPGGRCVSNNVPPNGLLMVCLDGHGCSRVRGHLVSDHHSHVVLLRYLL